MRTKPQVWAVHLDRRQELLRVNRSPEQSIFRLEVGLPRRDCMPCRLSIYESIADPRFWLSPDDLVAHNVDAVA